jgi:NAD(P)-dependent dehydrogenase (short-subunit alcohol dehydrogenase family)
MPPCCSRAPARASAEDRTATWKTTASPRALAGPSKHGSPRALAGPCHDAGAVRALEQQTILITGATDGLGRALAAELAAGGASLLIHGRDDERGNATIAEIRERSGNATLRWLRADLASLEEVRALARQVADECERLDALVNNAGIGTTLPGDGGRMESRDGYELRFAVNYLAGYLLTRSLLPLLQHSAPARVVNVSSAGQAPIDFDDVMLARGYDGVQAYCQSKLAQIMFTFDLAAELDASAVSATCLHPGTYMPTKIVRAAGVEPVTALEQGVNATRRLVADRQLDGVSGVYFNGLGEARPHPQANDPEARRKLRELSDRLCELART